MTSKESSSHRKDEEGYFTVRSEPWLQRNLATLIGFAINLIVLGIFIGRQTQIITALELRTTLLEQRITSHHEDSNLHTTAEWRASVLRQLDRLETKMDSHISAEFKSVKDSKSK